MAALIDAARAARAEAHRLRMDERRLQARMHENLASRDDWLGRAGESASIARGTKSAGVLLPSPWSSLMWRSDDEELGSALVPVD